jgi:LDH2 family malate/lactate/ureidoglycolate dehydrogenase
MSFSAAVMLAFAREVFSACGLPDSDAATVAGALIEADLVGADAQASFGSRHMRAICRPAG